MEIKECIDLVFSVVTGVATAGTFFFMLLDRKPRCEIQVKTGSDKVGNIQVPKLVITVTNTGRSDIFIARTWILSNEENITYQVNLSPGTDSRKGLYLGSKRRYVKEVYLEKILEEIKTLEQPKLLLWVEVHSEIGKVYHSKKVSIPSEQIEQVLITRARQARL